MIIGRSARTTTLWPLQRQAPPRTRRPCIAVAGSVITQGRTMRNDGRRVAWPYACKLPCDVGRLRCSGDAATIAARTATTSVIRTTLFRPRNDGTVQARTCLLSLPRRRRRTFWVYLFRGDVPRVTIRMDARAYGRAMRVYVAFRTPARHPRQRAHSVSCVTMRAAGAVHNYLYRGLWPQ